MRKTILFVHQSADLYGSDRVLLALVAKLERDKFLPIVLLPVDGPLVVELAAAGVECHVLPIVCLSRASLSLRGVWCLPANLIESIRAMNLAVKDRHIDWVHSNTLAVLSGAIWAFWYRVPHVWHVHEIILRPKFVRKAYVLMLSWFADHIICISKATKENLLQDKPALASKIQVVWNGLTRDANVNADLVRRSRHSLGVKDDEVLVVLVGRINRWKGQSLLVEAAGLLWQQDIRQIRFLIVGSAPVGQEHYLKTLQQVIDDSPARQCILIQPFIQDVWPVWDACDIAVIPSIEPEPFGMVALEAMAASTPVIAANHGGLAEIVVQGETGLLLPPGDARALADAIKQLAEDTNLRQQMGESGFRRYRGEFTLDRHVENMSRIYEGHP